MVTDRQTHTHTQNDYRNSAAHVPRVSKVAVLRFTVGQRTISGRFDHVTDHFAPWSDKMAGRKRASSLSESTSSDGAPASKRRMLLTKSVDKWIAEYDKELNTTTWLKYLCLEATAQHTLLVSSTIWLTRLSSKERKKSLGIMW